MPRRKGADTGEPQKVARGDGGNHQTQKWAIEAVVGGQTHYPAAFRWLHRASSGKKSPNRQFSGQKVVILTKLFIN